MFNYIKNKTYNFIVGSYTKELYRNFLSICDEGSAILDIGVGNGWSLCQNADIIKERNLKIFAIDICASSVERCWTNIHNSGLEAYVCVAVKDLFLLRSGDYQFFTGQSKFNYVYFSNSYSVIPDVLTFVRHACKYLSGTDGIYISTTLFSKYNRKIAFVKQNLNYLAFGIDFGRYITRDTFIEEVAQAKFKIKDMDIVYRRWIPIYGTTLIYTIHMEHCY